MLISNQFKDKEVFDNIHVSLIDDVANIFIGDTHIYMERKSFDRLLFTMQAATFEEEFKESNGVI